MRVAIDGNIGCGKSTQISLLLKEGYNAFPEKIDDWPLEEFYSDPVAWALPMQVSVLKSFLGEGSGIYERCPVTSHQVFWRKMVNDGTVSLQTDEEYLKIHRDLAWSPDLYIYLKRSPESCFANIQKRHQVGDSSVTLEYLRTLHDLYEKVDPNSVSFIIECDGASPHKINRIIKDVLEKYANMPEPRMSA